VIVCGNCNTRNEDDAAFCINCREPLEFTGIKVEEPEAARSGESVAVAESEGKPIETSDRFTQPPLTSNAQSAAAEPVAIPPAREVEAPRRRPAPRPAPDEPSGSVVCPTCHTGNVATASFCRRCGTPLAPAAERIPWWRRLFQRPRRTMAAGERRRARSGAGLAGTASKARSRVFSVLRLVALVSVLAACLGAATIWRGGVSDLYDRVRGVVFPRYESLLPSRVRATTRLKAHAGSDAFDRNLATFWAEGAPGDGVGQKLVARFNRPVDLARIGITAGRPNDVVSQPTPRRLRLRAFDAGGRRVGSKVVTLEQTDTFQRFDFSAKPTTRLVITIVAVYPGRRGHAASIIEVEPFVKK
jgi:hypothetical protein